MRQSSSRRGSARRFEMSCLCHITLFCFTRFYAHVCFAHAVGFAARFSFSAMPVFVAVVTALRRERRG